MHTFEPETLVKYVGARLAPEQIGNFLDALYEMSSSEVKAHIENWSLELDKSFDHDPYNEDYYE